MSIKDSLIRFWHWLSSIGIKNFDYLAEPHQRIALSNQAGVVVFLLNFLLCIYDRELYRIVGIFEIFIFFSFLYLLTLFFNYIRWYFFAGFWLFFCFETHIFIAASVFGYESNVHFFYILTLFSIVMGFGSQNKLPLFSGLIMTALFLLGLYITDFSLLKFKDLPTDWAIRTQGTVFFISIVGSAVLAYIYEVLIAKKKKTLQKEIEERIKKEKELQKSEAKLKALIENTKDGIWSVDKHYKTITINSVFVRVAKEIYGVAIKEGDDLLKNFPPDIVKTWKSVYERAFAGESFKIEWSYFNPKKEKEFFVETQVSPIINQKNEIEGATLFTRDITQRRESEALIKQKDQLLYAINHNIKEGIFRSSIERGGIYVNQEYIKMFGYDNAEDVLNTPPDTLYVDKLDRDRLIKKLLVDESVNNDEVIFKRKDGSTFWGLISAILTTDEGGERFFDGIVRDITELKNIQVQLQKAKEIAEESARSKSQFLSSMSHEIRTPLNAIIGITRLLSEENPRPEQVENLNTLSFSARNLLVLINDILDFNKIEAGKVVFENIDYDLRELLKNIKHGFQLAAEDNNNLLVLDVENALPSYIKGDPTRMSQILTNLVGNAIKFTKNGKITISVSLAERREGEVGILLSVTDTGIGIPKEKQSIIFEGFTQANIETTRKYGGTGLGLAITKRLLEMQDSHINLESEVGKGTKFYFTIFFKESDKKQSNALANPPATFVSFKGQKILVVEDNLANQLVAKRFLTKWGLQPSIAEDGEIALKLINYEDFDLILMDIQMPNMNGYEATRAIRKLNSPKYQQLPIIALTASVTSEVGQKVIDAGMNDFVLKPFEPEELYQKIAHYLEYANQAS